MDTHEACQASGSTPQDAQKDRQQGRSEQRGEAYASFGTLSPLSDARTMLADFFSFLLSLCLL